MSTGTPFRQGTPWGRLAQIARSLTIMKLTLSQFEPQDKPFPIAPTAEEYSEAFRKQIELEIIWGRIEENETMKLREGDRLTQLHSERRRLESEIAREVGT